MISEQKSQNSRILHALDIRLFNAVYDNRPDDVGRQFQAYVLNIGFRRFESLRSVRNMINGNARVRGLIADGASAFDRYGRLREPFLETLDPFPFGFYKDPIDDSDGTVIWPASSNEWADSRFPHALTHALGRKERTSLRCYEAKRGTLYADSVGYQVYDETESHFFRTGSPFCYSNIVLHKPVTEIAGDLVVVADLFDGTNICHFLLDWLARLHAFLCRAPGCRKFRFVFGGAPGPLHKIVLEGACRLLGIEADDLVFPDQPMKLRATGSVYWFSDSFEQLTHPGQLMHPSTVAFLRQLALQLQELVPPAPRSPRKLYISRTDAALRRIANETDIRRFLEDQGFCIAELAHMPASEQIRLVAGADIIVAPHGMGLTHIAFNTRQPKIIELFHPTKGTDAYAILARALGMDYRYLTGTAIEGQSDFTIGTDALETVLSSSAWL